MYINRLLIDINTSCLKVMNLVTVVVWLVYTTQPISFAANMTESDRLLF